MTDAGGQFEGGERRWLTVACSTALVEHVDQLAKEAGLSRSMVVRLLLTQATAADLPIGIREHAALLRASRRMR